MVLKSVFAAALCTGLPDVGQRGAGRRIPRRRVPRPRSFAGRAFAEAARPGDAIRSGPDRGQNRSPAGEDGARGGAPKEAAPSLRPRATRGARLRSARGEAARAPPAPSWRGVTATARRTGARHAHPEAGRAGPGGICKGIMANPIGGRSAVSLAAVSKRRFDASSRIRRRGCGI